MSRAAFLVAVVLACAGRAEAKFLDLSAGARAGGVIGANPTLRGPGLGFEVGAEVVLLDATINYLQLFDGGGPAATLTQFLIGLDADIPVDGRLTPRTYLRFGGALGAAIVTPRPIDLPLDKGETSHWGFVTQAIFALDHHLNRVVVAGMEFVGGYHYFVPGGSAPVNTGDNLHGVRFMGLATLRVHFEPLR